MTYEEACKEVRKKRLEADLKKIIYEECVGDITENFAWGLWQLAECEWREAISPLMDMMAFGEITSEQYYAAVPQSLFG